MRKIFLSLFIAVSALLLAACHMGPDAPVITILHTNDTHSQIEPATRDGKTQGGVVERAAMIEYFRTQYPDLLYLDGGDMVQGSPYFNIFKGELEVLCMNQQKLVATTFGNHEFDNGLESLDSLLSLADFPLISCNYICTGTALENHVIPAIILKQNGVKIGITGVTCDPNGLIFNRNWEGIEYHDPVEAVACTASDLRVKGCDLVIVLSHVGYHPSDEGLDVKIARESFGVDIIIGAHSHINIEEGIYVNNCEGKPVLITQTGGKANPIGFLQITMKRCSGRNYNYEVDSIVCKKLHPEDYDLTGYGKDMEDLIAPYRERLANQMNEVIGHAPVLMDKGRPQSLLANFTADALLAMGEKAYGHKMDLSVMNNGGLRNTLNEGDVTIGTMFNIFPFENTLTILEMKGSDLADLINSLAGKKMEAMAGMNVTLELDGDRTYASSIKVSGKPIDPERTYYVSTIDYLAEGNSGMSAMTKATKVTNTGLLLRDVMIDYVKQLTAEGKEITSAIDDRVIDKAFKK